MEEFARNEYASFLIINFRTASRDVKSWFEIYFDDIDIGNLQLHYGKRLSPRQSLIVFDEIQNCPRAREAIKYLTTDGRFDYVETGSLVSIKKNVKDIQIPSEEYCISMYPMDFEEFLWETIYSCPICRTVLKNYSPLDKHFTEKQWICFVNTRL